MAGLVAYASSDEEEEVEQPRTASNSTNASRKEEVKVEAKTDADEKDVKTGKDDNQAEDAKPPQIGPARQNAVPLGPSLPTLDDTYMNEPDLIGQEPGSPYSANRAMLHNLTLPSVPDMDIPPSPPGSPPPGTNKKFEEFLDLKKKGVHFNSKLEGSTALRNPSLMDKLMGFVELDDRIQYGTTLPRDLWDPGAFPEWAFRAKLRESQETLAKEREAERMSGGRTAVDFVSSNTPSAGSTITPGGMSKSGTKRRGGWK